MPNTQITIKNLDRFNSAMQQAPKMASKYISDALIESLLIVQGEARKKSPVDTGRLRSSIGSGAGRARVNKNVGYVGTNVEYSVYVHEGTSRMKGRPFLANAVKETRAEIKKILEKSIERLWKDVKLKTSG